MVIFGLAWQLAVLKLRLPQLTLEERGPKGLKSRASGDTVVADKVCWLSSIMPFCSVMMNEKVEIRKLCGLLKNRVLGGVTAICRDRESREFWVVVVLQSTTYCDSSSFHTISINSPNAPPSRLPFFVGGTGVVTQEQEQEHEHEHEWSLNCITMCIISLTRN